MREKFTEDMKDAMRAKDQRRLSTLRLVLAALKDKDIELRGLGKPAATEDEILALLQKMIKQRNESIEVPDVLDRNRLQIPEQFFFDQELIPG